MLHEIRTLVVHDDAASARALTDRLRAAFPQMVVLTTEDASTYGHDFDVFVVDCSRLGVDIVRLLHTETPTALMLVIADGVDRATVKDLVNSGASAIFDAQVPGDLDALEAKVRGFLARRAESPDARGLLGVMRSMADLMRMWNRRMDRLEVS
jgi:DNA-binding NarL/FixJ family response regulator